ncbi:MAG TPA: hypothetical protein VMS17_23115 [Gemmataceae bacterium]|nr:hypothetical protein [Gemmataceae bacterium]
MKKLMCAAMFLFALGVAGTVSAASPSPGRIFSPPGEKFSISFPDAYVTKDDVRDGMTTYLDLTDSGLYAVTAMEIPANLREWTKNHPDLVLNGAADEVLRNAEVRNRNKVTVAGLPGEDITAIDDTGYESIHLHLRIIASDDRVYVLTVVGDETVTAKAKAFFDSFKPRTSVAY